MWGRGGGGTDLVEVYPLWVGAGGGGGGCVLTSSLLVDVLALGNIPVEVGMGSVIVLEFGHLGSLLRGQRFTDRLLAGGLAFPSMERLLQVGVA